MTDTNHTTLRKLCASFVERAAALNLKGKKRDDALMDYMIGAHVALAATGQAEDAQHVGNVAALLFSVRGYRECEQIARGL